MAVYFLDTSALVKRYVVEAGTLFVTQRTDPLAGNETWIATISFVEVVAALSRRVNMGLMTAAAAASAEQQFRSEIFTLLNSIDLTPTILASAMGLAKLHSLRAYDAIQLGTALDYQRLRKALNLSALIFLSSDLPLNQAARAEGLLVDDPNRYP